MRHGVASTRCALPMVLLAAGLALVAGPVASDAPAAANGTLTAGFASDATTPGTNTTLLVNASGDRAVVVSSPDLTDATLAETVAGTPVEGGVRANATDGSVRVRFPERFDCRPGDYRFTVTGVRTGRTANATLALAAPGGADPQLSAGVYTVRPGDTVHLAIDNDCSGEATLRVGSREAGFLANATVGLDRGRNPVMLDTGETSAPDDLFATGRNATLRRVSLVRPGDEPLPTGEYDLFLSADGSDKDAAVLNVTEDPAPASTPTGTPSPSPVTESATPTATATPTTVTSRTGSPPSTSPVSPTTAAPPVNDPGTTTDGQPGLGVVPLLLVLVMLLARIEIGE